MCFVCLSGFFFFFVSLFVFGFFSEEIRLIQGMGSGSFGSALDLFPFSRSAHDKCKCIYPHMCPDAMHHEATGFLLAWSKSPFPNKRITVPCIRKKLNIHCPAVFILHVRCDRILIKCQTYLFLIPSIT